MRCLVIVRAGPLMRPLRVYLYVAIVGARVACGVIRVETLEFVSRYVDGLAVTGVAVGLKQSSPWPLAVNLYLQSGDEGLRAGLTTPRNAPGLGDRHGPPCGSPGFLRSTRVHTAGPQEFGYRSSRCARSTSRFVIPEQGRVGKFVIRDKTV